MSDEYCACLEVGYDPIEIAPGTYRERWRCKDCRMEFTKRIPRVYVERPTPPPASPSGGSGWKTPRVGEFVEVQTSSGQWFRAEVEEVIADESTWLACRHGNTRTTALLNGSGWRWPTPPSSDVAQLATQPPPTPSGTEKRVPPKVGDVVEVRLEAWADWRTATVTAVHSYWFEFEASVPEMKRPWRSAMAFKHEGNLWRWPTTPSSVVTGEPDPIEAFFKDAAESAQYVHAEEHWDEENREAERCQDEVCVKYRQLRDAARAAIAALRAGGTGNG